MSFGLASRALDSAYRAFGKTATYAPPSGPTVDCLIIVNKRDDVANLGGAGFVSKRQLVEVRRSEVAAPQKDGRFIRPGETLKIAAAPKCEDDDALVWTCLCDPL